MRIDTAYYRWDREVEEPEQIMCRKEDAEGTWYVFTDFVGKEEYGMMVSSTEVADEIDPHILKTCTNEMERYAEDHST